MKKLLLTAGVALASFGVLAQGLVVMNTSGFNAYAKFSNLVSSVFFTGNQIYVALYWATDAATLAAGGGNLATNMAADTPGGTNGTGVAILNSLGFITSGTFGGNRFIEGRAGQSTFFQLRAWTANSGVFTYAEAAAMVFIDTSIIISQVSGTLAAPIVQATPSADALSLPSQIQWNPGATTASQTIGIPLAVLIPEPSTIALIGLGLAGLVFISRRK
jgi:hypothetical protein